MVVGRALSYGEVSPSLQKRVDLDSYARSAKQLENWMVKPEGGAETRPGSKLIAPTKYGTSNFTATQRGVVLRPFIFNSDESNVYVLEIGHQYIRFHKNGAQIRTTGQVVSGITKANPGVLTYVGADPSNGDEFYLSGVHGMQEVNGEWVIVGSVDGVANTFNLLNRDTTNVRTVAYGTYDTGGTIEKVYEISTPYSGLDVGQLSLAQNGDTIIIAHADYAPRKLVRTSDTSWALSTISFTPTTTYPAWGSGVAGAGTAAAVYQVTAIGANGVESLPGAFLSNAIAAITKANPAAVTTTGNHNLVSGDEVLFSSMAGMTELEGRRFSVTVTGATTFTVDRLDSTSYGAFVSGNMSWTFMRIATADAPTNAAPNSLAWTAVSGATSYVIYRQKNGLFGFVGTAQSVVFKDVGVTPDLSDTPFKYVEVFGSTGNYPSCVAFGKQRLLFGAPDNNPNRVIGSVVGDYYNFSTKQVSVASDSITLDLLGGYRVQIVRSMREVAGRVIAFCSEGEFGLGDDNGVLDATAPDAKQFSGNGSTALPALLISNIATYVQARSSQVRDLAFSFEENGYRGEERSVRSKHLFKGHTITDWCYQQVPNSVIYAVRDDGVVLGCTYVREQQMAAWYRLTWNPPTGLGHLGWAVKTVCSVPESDGDAVYLVVDRAKKLTVERLATRQIVGPDSTGVESVTSSAFAVPATFGFVNKGIGGFNPVDCAHTYDGRNTNSAIYMGLDALQTPYDTSHSLTLSSTTALGVNVSYFYADDVGKALFLYEPTDSLGQEASRMCKFTITAYNNAHNVTGTIDRTAPAGLNPDSLHGPTNVWSKAVNKVYGLRLISHSNPGVVTAPPVSVIGDGFVEASPLNPAYTALGVASDFTVTLAHHHERISVGNPVMATFEALDIDTQQVPGGGLINKSKVVDKMYVAVEETRGLYIGAQPPSDDFDDPLESLQPLVDRRANDFAHDAPLALSTDIVDQDCTVNWDSHGRCIIRQVDPLPATILAIMPDGITGGI